MTNPASLTPSQPPSEEMTSAREALRANTLQDEVRLVTNMLKNYPLSQQQIGWIEAEGTRLVRDCRARGDDKSVLDAFLQQFGLSNSEGVALMCLAEALLRVPDADTADELIAEKVLAGDWDDHLRASDSVFVNASTWALMLTGRVISLNPDMVDDAPSWLGGLVARAGEPVIRNAMQQAMKILGGEFVLGQTLDSAMQRAGGICSFDMLGEGARTEEAARKYYDAYAEAIETLASKGVADTPESSHGISVKLSALHPRYDALRTETGLPVVIERAKALARMAAKANLNFTLDAEEANRLDISLDLFAELAADPETKGWQGLGLAVQCYSRRALDVMQWLIALAKHSDRRFMVRLVKGAYWDTEIKHAQELGLESYPVFTRKLATDLSYLSCARLVLQHVAEIYPQFATHNAHTVTAILAMTKSRNFEFQRLHGMGELLYSQAVEQFADMPTTRVYAPVGAHKDLLAYLVRRLLENGANSSFVNRFLDQQTPAEFLLRDPGRTLRNLPSLTHPDNPAPPNMYGAARQNSPGVDIFDTNAGRALFESIEDWRQTQWKAGPIISGELHFDESSNDLNYNPAKRSEVTGAVTDATKDQVDQAMTLAAAAQPDWDELGGQARATVLLRMADLLIENRSELLALLQREAGKTIDDAIGEAREAEDFLRYYAAQAAVEFAAPQTLPGPTGEINQLSLHGRGVFVCISPWNFPLAIFLGQIAAALAAGNTVVAKPADQTPLIATRCVQLLLAAGVPKAVLSLLPGPGSVIGAALVDHALTAGVAMTGSTATAQRINQALAAKSGPIVPLIAETGGQNAMFVDSTALPEQVTDDLIQSAFLSAGQRCSAVRVLYVQEDVADAQIDMLIGAMDELLLGDPANYSTDIGPIIDEAARQRLQTHIDAMQASGKLLHIANRILPGRDASYHLAPALIELENISELDDEHFGPVLHVIRFKSQELDERLAELKATGFGLTLGIHSRLSARAQHIFRSSLAGNVYVNRNTTGAVVGVQPFGGSGLSGTGPKAGGPHYLHRYAVERVYTENVAASGGNTDLFRLTTA